MFSTPLSSRVLFVVFACSALVSQLAQAHKCTNPAVRREWRSISANERAEWLSAVKCLAQMPHNNSLTPSVDPSLSKIPPVNTSGSYFDDISYVHMDLNELIHFTGFFLPWHRVFVQSFENNLKDYCGYNGTQPYWDWTIDAPDFYHSTMWDPSPSSGVGGWGDPNNDFQITDGAFDTGFPLSYPSPHRLRRNFTLTVSSTIVFEDGSADVSYSPYQMLNLSFTKESQVQMVNGFVGDYTGFQAFMEGSNGSHRAIHRIVGADLTGLCPLNAPKSCVPGPKWSPNDPLFMLHHGMIDKLWYDWQHKNPSNFWSFHGGSVRGVESASVYAEYPNGAPPFLNFSSVVPGDGILPKLTIGDVMDTIGETLCYVYE